MHNVWRTGVGLRSVIVNPVFLVRDRQTFPTERTSTSYKKNNAAAVLKGFLALPEGFNTIRLDTKLKRARSVQIK